MFFSHIARCTKSNVLAFGFSNAGHTTLWVLIADHTNFLATNFHRYLA